MSRREPQDMPQRRAALAGDRSLIVQAPAGSGKTTLLVQRYLKVLARVDRPEQVVVITFTRKATGELQDRVLTALEQAASGCRGVDDVLFDLATRVLERDKENNWGLLQMPSRLGIYTIDALCAVLVRQMPWLSGLGAMARIEEQPEALYQQAVVNVLAGLNAGHGVSADLVRVFEHLDNDLGSIRALLVRMLARREQWTPYLQTNPDAGAQMRDALQRGLALIIETQLAELSSTIPQSSQQSLLELVHMVGDVALVSGQTCEYSLLAGISALPEAKANALPAWRALADLLLTADGKHLRKSAVKAQALVDLSAGEAAQIKAIARVLLPELAVNEDFATRLIAVARLPEAKFTQDEWPLLLSLLEILKLALAELRLIFAAQGSVDFSEITAAALQALGPASAPTDLGLALDYRIQHLLVDEFQDTSRAHYELVERLTEGFSEEDGRSLFLVGDPMQSIYRFRAAEVGLFLSCVQRGMANMDLGTLRLEANFRSRPALVDWVNHTFAKVFPPRHDAPRSCVAYARAEAQREASEQSMVSLHGFLNAGGAQHAQRVVAIVADIRQSHPDQSVAILVRSRSHLVDILPALRAAGLRYRGTDIEPLAAVPVVRDLHALTRALLQPADRMSWLAILRAPWCGLRLADLYALVGDDWNTGVAKLLNDSARRTRLDSASRERLEAFLEALTAAINATDSVRLKRRVEACWIAVGGPGYCNSDQILDARRYLQLLDKLETDNEGMDIDRLTRRLGDLYASAQSGEADLDIMTMHKAKGLEFDQVILPHLEKRPRAPDPPLLQWSEIAFSAGTSLVFAAKPAAGGDSRRYQFVNALEADKQQHESARLLYVACTRAREQLHLIYNLDEDRKQGLKKPPNSSLLAHLWPVMSEQLGEDLATATTVGESEINAEPASAMISRLACGWQPPVMAEVSVGRGKLQFPLADARSALEFDWAGQAARHVGTVVHRALRNIAVQGLAAWSAQRVEDGLARYQRELEQLGVVDTQLETASQRVVEALRKTLADDRGRWLFATDHSDSRCELSLCGLINGQVHRVYLDRSFVDMHNVRWIVDYKTGWHAGTDREGFLDAEQQRYAPQLQRYAGIMQHLDSRSIRVGLYFPLLGGWREWEFAVNDVQN